MSCGSHGVGWLKRGMGTSLNGLMWLGAADQRIRAMACSEGVAHV